MSVAQARVWKQGSGPPTPVPQNCLGLGGFLAEQPSWFVRVSEEAELGGGGSLGGWLSGVSHAGSAPGFPPTVLGSPPSFFLRMDVANTKHFQCHQWFKNSKE